MHFLAVAHSLPSGKSSMWHVHQDIHRVTGMPARMVSLKLVAPPFVCTSFIYWQAIMGIDHGLGGKDTLKSKLRREKRAKRTKNIAKKLQSEDLQRGTKEVKFDDAARVAWLTGFRKRKQERRKYGLAMQVSSIFGSSLEFQCIAYCILPNYFPCDFA
ncbi:hypothetical protein EON65_14915 [archaeon]|nr:MAG: hypothetical protein EON65_14915 [archaeon]